MNVTLIHSRLQGRHRLVGSDLPQQDGSVRTSNALIGTHHWATILLDYCDSPNDSECDFRRSAQAMKLLIDTRYNSVVNYFTRASYGKFNINMDFYGWIQPNVTLSSTTPGYLACFPSDNDRFKIIVDYDPSIVLQDYDGFLFIIRRPRSHSCPAGIANGYGPLPRLTRTSQGEITTRVAFVGATIYPDNFSKITSSTAVHEILHTYGLQHVNAIHCNDDQIIDFEGNGEDCINQAYGDLFSIMGLRSFASLPDPVNLDNLGWITPSKDLQIIQESGDYTIFALEKIDSPIKALRIDIINDDDPISLFNQGYTSMTMDRVYIHYRGFTGFDNHNLRIPLKDGTQWTPPNMNGAFVHAADCSSTAQGFCRAMLLDMNPNHEIYNRAAGGEPRYGPHRVIDALLYEGEQRDLGKFTIETISVQPRNSITIRITFR